jgi:HPt (histidine-containing phosphotransfer) domain-containing protein
MPYTFTREEFYDLVWTTPMSSLGKRFLISDVALHKMCAKYLIPTPTRGYWAKLAAGKQTVQAKLPLAKKDTPKIIVLAGEVPQQEPSVAPKVRQKARIALASFDQETHQTISEPAVLRTIRALRKVKPDSRGLLVASGTNMLSVQIAPESLDRLEVALSRIAAAASFLGIRLVSGDNGAHFLSNGNIVPFEIRETVRRIDHVLTAEEIAEDIKKQTPPAKPWLRHEWHFRRRPRFDFVPSGILCFEFCGHFRHANPVRKTYRDGKTQRLEDMALDIVAGVAVFAANIDEETRLEAIETAIREDAHRKRKEAAAAAFVETRRAEALAEILKTVTEIDRLQRLVEPLRDKIRTEGFDRVTAFLAYADATIAKMKARLESAALERTFLDQNLFGSEDAKNFEFREHRFYG